VGAASLLTFLAAAVGGTAPIELSRQLITLPANASAPLFADTDGDGRSDLLVLDPVEKKLLNYHQRPAGFTNSPDQVIPLPPQTAWVAPCDVDAHPGLELLMSTAAGLIYSRQNAGLFESERRTLIKASQVFTNNDFPILTSLSTNKAATNDLIPVISAGRTVLYQRNSAYEWNPGPPLTLDAKRTAWYVDSDNDEETMDELSINNKNRKRRYLNPNDYEWTMGPNPARSLRVQRSIRAKPDQQWDKEAENKEIRKIIDDMKKTGAAGPPMMNRVDVDGDGREDLVLWQISGKLDFKTDLHIFLRGADRRLPEAATQILRCRGFAMPAGSVRDPSPVADLNGDGVCELALLELKTTLTSPGGFVEVALTHGLDWSLTIRSFQRGGFSVSPNASVPVTTIIGAEDLREWPICIQGDFNGDGRPDLLARRSDFQWNIFFSTTGKSWFPPQPALTFNAPAHGYFEINDLDGDGLADVIWREPDESRLSIFMSPPRKSP
jgi:hypothetical protein